MSGGTITREASKKHAARRSTFAGMRLARGAQRARPHPAVNVAHVLEFLLVEVALVCVRCVRHGRPLCDTGPERLRAAERPPGWQKETVVACKQNFLRRPLKLGWSAAQGRKLFVPPKKRWQSSQDDGFHPMIGALS